MTQWLIGVLAISITTNGTQFPAFDGNGNVSALVEASSGEQTAVFAFGTFGEPIRIEGIAAASCPVRFSSKYQDAETDLFYYGVTGSVLHFVHSPAFNLDAWKGVERG